MYHFCRISSMESLLLVFVSFLACMVAHRLERSCDLDNEALESNICEGNEFCEEYSKLQNLIRNDEDCAASLPLRNVTYNAHQRPVNLPNCTKQLVRNGRIHERSLAPWAWIRNVHAHRTPQTILEVACNCPYCLHAHQPGKFNYDLVVKPITVELPVKYRAIGSDGDLMEKRDTTFVTVGCRCDLFQI